MISREDARVLAKEIVQEMTIAEKIDQINFRAPAIPRLSIKEYNYWNEGLHGVARAGVATVFPQAIGLAAAFDEKLLQDVAEVISIEGRAKYNEFAALEDRDIYKGLTYWSPNLNLFRDPRWGRGQETYGEDPLLIARLGKAFIQGLQGDGAYLRLAACAKHFAVHSGPEKDRHSFNAEASLKDLNEFYLPAFQAAVEEADVESVMGSYNAINGIPACVNQTFLQKILRQQWHFDGHVVSDYAALEDVHEQHHYTKSANETMALAIKAGCHLCAGEISDALFEALSRGLVTEEEITQAVVSLYTTRVRLGMFDEDCEFNAVPYEINDSPKHQEVNLEAAQRAMVLLKNDHFLPMDKKELTSVAVIGPNAANQLVLSGNYFGTASKYHTFLSGIQDELADSARVYYALGSHLFRDHAESGLSKPNERESEALIAAKYSDAAILCLGLDPTIEGEQGDSGNVYGAGDKDSLSLPPPQKRLLTRILEQGKPVVVILSSGSALSLDGLEEHPLVKAVIQTWYPGSFGGKALADILFGHISPSGKLPVTFYQDSCELPDFKDYAMDNRTYQNTEARVNYPFGYGLNYGNSQITNVELTISDRIQLTMELENNSDWSIEEVLQIYVQIHGSSYAPRHWKLVDFKRIQLAGSANHTLVVELEKNCLQVVNEQGQRIFDGERVTFHIGFSQPDEHSQRLTGKKVISQTTLLSEITG
ncbi:glycoside hydrolase family 3 C-terminal domain-containing protein [Enterococcus sp. CWB-B31]|uniref:glycoside hydrolase family 3 C-terminal domain-containing protein n=1 Tax=Enterococcus sp. CWB-B31 TaxID=2885159 RepID=UPI001E4CAAD9|nr:glycoside hydrolase family 3 C-terminal domain-containing protein [Enterococcus sp. CWB-B31]MCB5954224.1 glycoside hydrolase family 3 C-terminal domain-containing protein [Enterococcus sp. CWB-B31]